MGPDVGAVVGTGDAVDNGSRLNRRPRDSDPAGGGLREVSDEPGRAIGEQGQGQAAEPMELTGRRSARLMRAGEEHPLRGRSPHGAVACAPGHADQGALQA